MKPIYLFICLFFFILNSCISQTLEKYEPQLIIKTIIPKGSICENEFGNQADWIEVYNDGDIAVDLGEYKWFITDNPKRPKKYRLPNKIIGPKKSIIIWCDDENRVRNQIHTNFKLSSYGETIVLSYKSDDELLIIDTVSYMPLDIDSQMAICRTDKGLVYRQLSADRGK
jgi:lamin tail-like protein